MGRWSHDDEAHQEEREVLLMVTYRTARLIVSVSIGVLVGVLTDTAASWPMVVAAVSGFGMALVLDFVKACPDKRMDD